MAENQEGGESREVIKPEKKQAPQDEADEILPKELLDIISSTVDPKKELGEIRHKILMDKLQRPPDADNDQEALIEAEERYANDFDSKKHRIIREETEMRGVKLCEHCNREVPVTHLALASTNSSEGIKYDETQGYLYVVGNPAERGLQGKSAVLLGTEYHALIQHPESIPDKVEQLQEVIKLART